mmetsp:Transcript_20389/g.39053  ORF Transcript_20389/g.39053 Transcript_20389/m.39053 type:complete len:209 (-) Transcript_20389:43-669(-)
MERRGSADVVCGLGVAAAHVLQKAQGLACCQHLSGNLLKERRAHHQSRASRRVALRRWRGRASAAQGEGGAPVVRVGYQHLRVGLHKKLRVRVLELALAHPRVQRQQVRLQSPHPESQRRTEHPAAASDLVARAQARAVQVGGAHGGVERREHARRRGRGVVRGNSPSAAVPVGVVAVGVVGVGCDCVWGQDSAHQAIQEAQLREGGG